MAGRKNLSVPPETVVDTGESGNRDIDAGDDMEITAYDRALMNIACCASVGAVAALFAIGGCSALVFGQKAIDKSPQNTLQQMREEQKEKHGENLEKTSAKVGVVKLPNSVLKQDKNKCLIKS